GGGRLGAAQPAAGDRCARLRPPRNRPLPLWRGAGRQPASRLMLEALGRFDIRFRWLIVAAWLIGAIAANRFLPSTASVAQSNNVVFLSTSAPSQRAATLAAPFRTTNASATAVIVAARPDGPLTTADNAALDRRSEEH